MPITQSEIKELLHYDPDSGVFTRLTNVYRVNAGDIAGSKHSKGYLTIGIKSKQYFAHRLAFLYVEGALPSGQVDHINGVKNDNRWKNLRHATNTENHKNTKRRSDNASCVTGVAWHRQAGKWRAYITVGGRQISLGCHDDFSEAVEIRKLAESECGFHENHGRVW